MILYMCNLPTFCYVAYCLCAGGIQLGSSKEIVVAWWGQHKHPLCKVDPSVNTIVCHPEDSDTMICTQSTSWMEYILNLGQTCSVADIFSSCGEYCST